MRTRAAPRLSFDRHTSHQLSQRWDFYSAFFYWGEQRGMKEPRIELCQAHEISRAPLQILGLFLLRQLVENRRLRP